MSKVFKQVQSGCWSISVNATLEKTSHCAYSVSLSCVFWRGDPATVNITDEMSKGSFGNVWKSVSPVDNTKKEPSAKRLASSPAALSDIQRQKHIRRLKFRILHRYLLIPDPQRICFTKRLYQAVADVYYWCVMEYVGPLFFFPGNWGGSMFR